MTKIEEELNKIVDSKMATILENARRMEIALRQREVALQHQRIKKSLATNEKVNTLNKP